MLMPTGHTPWVLAALAVVAGFTAMRLFCHRNNHLGIAWLIAGLAGGVLAFLLPEPSSPGYRSNMDLRVSFLMLQVMVFMGWSIGTGAGALALHWRDKT